MLSKRLMSAFLFQLFLCTVLLANTGNAQRKTIEEVKISMNLQEQSLAQFFRQVESKTDFKFTYTDNLVDLNQAITVVENNKSLYDVLVAVSMQTHLNFVQVNENIHVKTRKESYREKEVSIVVDADINVNGTVKDKTGEPIPGVTVLVKGTTIGTVTDIDGKYFLVAPEGAVLIFSFIGFESQSIVLGDKSIINIILNEDITSLDELVVVGYGTQKKSDITGAVASINERSLREMPVTNTAQMLQGRAAGVDVVNTGNRPGDGVSIRVRGNRSFAAGNDPLFVIDGIPITGGTLNSINPSDIISIDVLKDASSTAIYGSRGANGVIIVTTRRGQPGKVMVNYNSYVGLQRIMKYPNLMNGEQFAEYKRESRRSIGKYDDNDPDADKKLFHPIELQSLQEGRSTDWYKLFIEDGFVQNQNLSISGGTESTKYSISLGLFDNKGIIPNHEFSRYNVRLNLDQKIGKRIAIGISSLGTYSQQNGTDVDPLAGAGSDYGAFSENPLGVPYDVNGNLIFRNTPGDGNRTNPLFDIDPEQVINRMRTLQLFNSIYGEINILKGLKFRMNFGPDLTYNSQGDFRGSLTQVNAGGPSSAKVKNGFNFAYTWENLVTYNTTISESHRFDFTGLFSRQLKNQESFGSEVRGLPVDSFEYYNMAAASQYENIQSNYEQWGIESYMARLNYVYDDRYLLTLTGRADGSSKFAEGNKWGFFPSVAFGWNITNENFFANNKTVSNLRFRASYGKTGNEGLNPYQTQGLLARRAYLFGETPAFGYVTNSIRNNNLKWESTSSLNFGLDYELFDGRISGALEVYQSNTTDLLLPRLLPNTSGFGSIIANVGSTRNTGIEFSVSTRNITAKSPLGFSWSTDFNIYTNREEILELSLGKVDDIGNLRFIGQPLNVIYDFERVGIWQQGEDVAAKQGNSGVGYIKVRDLNEDGKISPDDRKILGSDVPDFVSGMTQRFSYQGFDLSIVAYARVGQMIRDFSYGSNRFNSGRVNMFNLDYWTPKNPTNYIPRPNTSLETPYFGSTLSYFDGSFVKIRNINLGYNFSQGIIDKLGIQSFNLYVSVQNPLFISPYISKHNGVDPEFPTRSTPVSRTFMTGVNINF